MSNIKTDDLTLKFGGVSVRGQLSTDLDNGKSEWKAYTVGRVTTLSSIVSEKDVNGNWNWISNGNFFEDLRNSNQSLRTQYSSLEQVSGAFYSSTSQGSPISSLNSGRTNQFNVYGAPVTAQRLGVPGASNVSRNTPTSDSQEGNPTQVNNNQLPTSSLENLNLLSGAPLPGRPIKENYGSMRYPEDMKEMDVVTFTAKQYGGRGLATGNTIGFSESRNFGKTLGTATLGIQPTINDTNTVNWSGLEMNLLESVLAGSGLSFIEGGVDALKGYADKAINSLKLEPGAQQALLTLIAQEGAGTKGLLSRLTGGISNPNLELLFQGPQLRTFNFNFSLSPRRKSEATQVKKIINFFKRNMSVQRSTANLFLKAPNVFDIQYLYAEGEEHKGLNKIKTCALLNCSVDYTPTGSYMTFEDNSTQSMVTYNLSLTFQELEPVYEDDYKDESNVTEIGY